MKTPRVALVRLPGAPAGIPALPADLMQPLIDESHVAYFQPTPPPFYFLHSSHLPGGTVSPPHRHPCLAFHGCLQGPVSLFIGKKEHVVDGGVFYLIAPGVVHSWESRGPHTAAHISMLLDQRRPGGWARCRQRPRSSPALPRRSAGCSWAGWATPSASTRSRAKSASARRRPSAFSARRTAAASWPISTR